MHSVSVLSEILYSFYKIDNIPLFAISYTLFQNIWSVWKLLFLVRMVYLNCLPAPVLFPSNITAKSRFLLWVWKKLFNSSSVSNGCRPIYRNGRYINGRWMNKGFDWNEHNVWHWGVWAWVGANSQKRKSNKTLRFYSSAEKRHTYVLRLFPISFERCT